MVIDASVSLKWVLDDEVEVVPSLALRDEAIGGRLQMLAPSLWIYEVTNALVVARLRERIRREQGEFALFLLQDIGVRLVDPDPRDCLELAADYALSGYDAAYVALAETIGVELWTGDWRLFERARGQTEVVRWIGDFAAGT